MKKFFLIAATSLVQFTLFSQIDIYREYDDPIEHEVEIKKTTTNKSFFEDDLLIARRTDSFEEFEFALSDSTEYYYDENNFLALVVNLQFDGTQWNDWIQTFYEHDNNGNRILFYRQRWIGQDWVNDFEYSYNYDENNNRLHQTIKRWMEEEWQYDRKTSYSYDGENKLITILNQDYELDQWVNQRKDTLIYNDNNLRSEQLTDIWSLTEWKPHFKTTFLYNDQNYLIESDQRRWNDPDWGPFIRYRFTRDDEGRAILEIRESILNGEYENQTKREWTYDNNGFLQEDYFSRWDSIMWVFDISRYYTYDERENLSYRLLKSWVDDDWEDDIQSFYYYRFPSNQTEIENVLDFKITPNPSHGKFNLALNEFTNKEIEISILSLDGKLIFHTLDILAEESTEINISHLNAGVYLIQILSDHKIGSKKLVLQN